MKTNLSIITVLLVLLSINAIAQAPSIVTNPSNSTICEGANTSFSINANNATAYQWQISTNSGATWVNLLNTGPYSNVSTATLNITSALAAMTGSWYRCEATGPTPPPAVSSAATLTVNPLAIVSVQPPVQTVVCAGTSTSISFTAPNATNFQWYGDLGSGFTILSNNATYSGVNTSTLNISNVNGSTIGTYRCIISNSCTPAFATNTSVLNVYSTTSVTSNPANTTSCVGANTYFNVSASGSSLVYQWQESTNSGATWSNLSNSATYGGVNGTQLTIFNTPLSFNNNQYRCHVIGACLSSAISGAGTLTLNTAPAITLQPGNVTICQNGNTSFSVNGSGTSISYQWQVNTGSGFTNISNTGVYSGANTATLAITGAPASMTGYQYRCAVLGVCPTNPALSSAATLTVTPFVAITNQPPVSSFICAGGSTSISFSHIGGTIFQWYVDQGSGFTPLSNNATYSGVNTGTLTINNGSVANTGTYRCIFSNACSGPVVTTTSILNIYPTTTITSQPSSVTNCVGINSYFTVAATGASLVYQWQVSTNGGSTWANLSNATFYSGVNNNQLTVTAPAITLNGYQFRCFVSGSCSSVATSNAATLNLNTTPLTTVSVQPPTSTTVCTGSPTSISFTALNASSYQWQIDQGSGFTNVTNSGVYSGATTPTLSISTASPATNGTYRCIVSGTCNSITTNNTILNVYPVTIITAQPVAVNNCINTTNYFTVNATGASLVYQWQVSTNGGTTWSNLTASVNYSGVNANQLTIQSTPLSFNNNLYRCVATGTCSSTATSNAALLTLNTPPSVASDPSNTSTCFNSNASFSVSGAGTSISYQWQVNTGSGFSNVSNTGVYSGANNATLNITSAPTTMNGYLYRCAISGICQPSPVFSNSATLTVIPPVSITTQPPVSTTVCSGNSTSITFSHIGGSNFQWYVDQGSGFVALSNNATYSGVNTGTLNIVASVATTGTYRCIFSNSCSGPVVTTTSILNVYPPTTIISHPTSLNSCAGGYTYFTVGATGTSLAYQWQLSTNGGTTWANLTNTTYYSGVNAPQMTITGTSTALNGYKFRCYVTGACQTTATSDIATLTVITAPVITTQPVNTSACPNSNTSLSVVATGTTISYQWQVNDGLGFVNIVNNSTYSGVATSSLNITGASTNMDGYSYRCIIGGICPGAPLISNAAMLTVTPLSVITTQPLSNIDICTGANTTISFTQTNATSFQWYADFGSGFTPLTNNTFFNGVNTDMLQISNATVAQTGSYRCMVGNNCTAPVATSSCAVNVYPVTTITSQPKDTIHCVGANAYFTVMATGTSLTYQWQVSTTNGNTWANLSNSLPYAGVQSSQLSIFGTLASFDKNLYRCTISDACQVSLNSTGAKLVVNPPPAIYNSPLDETVVQYNDAVFHATGNDIAGYEYSWIMSLDTGKHYTYVYNNSQFANAQTKDLTVVKAFPYLNGALFKCVVKTNMGCYLINSDTSEPAKLTVLPFTTSVSSVNGEFGNILLYPNPVSGSELMVKIDNPISKELHIRITDQVGKTLQSADIRLSQLNTANINIDGLSNGIYIIQFSDKNSDYTKAVRFTKQQ